MYNHIPRLIVPQAKRVNISKVFLQAKSRHLRSISDFNTGYYDVIISGGGLVGGAMACAVGSSPYFQDKKTLILESQPPSKSSDFDPSQPYSNRVCAISPSSKSLLKRFGVWKHISRRAPVKKMQVWDACSDASITFDKDGMTKDLCYIVENNMITNGIGKELKEFENCEMRHGVQIESCILPKNYAQKDVNDPLPNVTVKLKSGEELETSLLIAADGARSAIAQQAGFSKISWEYKQWGIVATLKLSEPSENIEAWQRFLPTGPIAMLPLDQHHSSLVWSTTQDHAEQLLALDEEEFVSEINNAFVKEYPKNKIISGVQDMFQTMLNAVEQGETPSIQLPPRVECLQGKGAKFPLGLSHCTEYVKPRLALIGDAAHRVHPLAGQGANLGFGDVGCLIEMLERAAYEGSDIGSLSYLMKYESERQLRNSSVQAVIDCLNGLYTTDYAPVVLLRTLGLMGTNANQFIKDQLINQAMR